MKLFGAKVQGLQPEAVLALVVASDTYWRKGLDLVVTSAVRSRAAALGVHLQGKASLHDVGLAFDLRLPSRCTAQPWPKMDEEIASELQNDLGPDYDVVLELDAPGGAHVHVEFDPK